MHDIQIFPDAQTLTDAAVSYFIHAGQAAFHERDQFSVALSGGSTPKSLYRALALPENRERLIWAKVHLFWGDERHVSPEDPDSNFRMVKETLLDQIQIPSEHVHRVPAEMEVRMAAFSYEERLRGFFEGDWPRFDLVLLGMGEDGHTASLFPKSAGLNEEHRWFIANLVPEQKVWRLTLSKNAINAARNILVLVQGNSKADMLGEVLAGPHEPFDKPIQWISPTDGQMAWLVEEEAASQLPADLQVRKPH